MIFVRFQGCPLNCIWCDTKRAKGKTAKCRIEKNPSCSDWVYIENPVDSQDIMRQLAHLYTPDTFAISFTGGEPLLQSSFLSELAVGTRIRLKCKTYLETSGYSVECLRRVISLMDYVKIDIKPPDARPVEDNYGELLENEMKSMELSLSLGKCTIIKVVVTRLTDSRWFEELVRRIRDINKENNLLNLTIQPCTETEAFKETPDATMLFKFSHIAGNFLHAEKIRVLPQVHKMLCVL